MKVFCPVCGMLKETIGFQEDNPILACGHVKELSMTIGTHVNRAIDMVLLDLVEDKNIQKIRVILMKMLEVEENEKDN